MRNAPEFEAATLREIQNVGTALDGVGVAFIIEKWRLRRCTRRKNFRRQRLNSAQNFCGFWGAAREIATEFSSGALRKRSDVDAVLA